MIFIRPLSSVVHPCPSQELGKIPFSNSTGLDIRETIVNVVSQRSKLFGLLQQIRNRRLLQLFGKKFQCGGCFFRNLTHFAVVAPFRSLNERSFFFLRKQPKLRGIARGFGEAQMLEGVAGDQPAARGALEQAFLNQERLDDLLDRIARLR